MGHRVFLIGNATQLYQGWCGHGSFITSLVYTVIVVVGTGQPSWGKLGVELQLSGAQQQPVS